MSMMPKAGETFFGCEILAPCGKGAFGVAYLARNPIGQKIVIKIVASPRGSERELKGLRHYMQVSGTHPNLLRVFHIGETEDGFFYTMEAADDCGKNGEYRPATLGNLFRKQSRFAPEKAIKIIRGLLAGLRVMHAAGLIHRDIKPDNIIFVNGVPKLSDPGLVVEVGEKASFAGTLGFIPPETLDGETPPDPHGDLYALGMVFYCMTTGNPPKRYPQLPEDLPLAVCRQIYPALIRMCSRDPARRFRSVDDFLAGLPVELEAPTRFEKLREDFRNWRLLNRTRWRAMLALALGGGLLLLAAGTVGTLLYRRCRAETEAFLAQEKARPGLTELQLEAFLPDRLAEYRELAGELAAASGDVPREHAAMRKLRTFLRAAAETAVPALPAPGGDFTSGIAASGALHGVLAAPLAEHLAPETRDELRRKLAAFDDALFDGWNGPRCGREWSTQQDYAAPMAFVPPGAVRMRHGGETVRIPYPYWICRNEVPHEDFTKKLGIAPQKSPYPNTPVERAAWNDMLHYCRYYTQYWQGLGVLPPGYIARPPTEAEWEYAAENAMLGPDTAPLADRAVFRDDAQGRTWPAGTRKPNRLGLFDIYGNVTECCLPHGAPVWQNAVTARGGSFRETPALRHRRRAHPAYQCIPDDVGFRMVIAPGTMEWFDRHFFLHGPQQAQVGGKIYELIGANSGSFPWWKADQTARLLGGALAEFPDADTLDRVRRALPQTGTWETQLGGQCVDGQWRWIRGGQPIRYGKWKRGMSGNSGDRLALHGNKWMAVGEVKLPLLLCEWNAAAYPRRNARLERGEKMPLELHRFTWNGRRFILFDLSTPWSAAYRICELLGGRIACLDTPELRKFAIAELVKFRDRKILLGGYAKYGEWRWLSGSTDIPDLRTDPGPIQSRNRNCIALRNGEFLDCQFAKLLLCEWPAAGR